MQLIVVMAESTRIRGMNVERIVEQILNAMEDEDEEIYREIENSDFDFSVKIIRLIRLLLLKVIILIMKQ